MSDSVDRAVLELTTGGSTQRFLSDLESAERKAVSLGKTFDTTGREAKKLGATSSELGRVLDDIFGTDLQQRAMASATGIMQVGGASKLTNDEVKRHLSTLDAWIAKAKRLGQEVSPQILSTRDALAKVNAEGQKTPSIWDQMNAKSVALGAAIGTFIGGMAWSAVNKLGDEIGRFVGQGAKLPALQQSFNRLAVGVGADSQQMLSHMQIATRGLVSNYDLMQSANKAMLLGLPVTSQEMGELSSAATVLGRAMGQDATKSLDDLITALGRSSPMILDNLGLTVKVSEANEAYAAKMQIVGRELTETEKKQAFYVAAMEAARKKTAELGEQTRTLGELASAAWTKFGNAVTGAVAIANTQIPKILTNFEKAKQFAIAMAMLGGPGQGLQFVQGVDDAAARIASRKDTHLSSAPPVDPLVAYRQELDKVAASIVKLTPEQARLATRALALGQSVDKVSTALGVNAISITKWQESTKKAEKSATDLKKHFADVRDAIDSVTAKMRVGPPGTLPGLKMDGAALNKWFFGAEVPDLKAPLNLAFQRLPGQLHTLTIPAAPPSVWQKMFGDTAALGQQLGQSIMGAIQGGGSVFGAAAGTLGTSITTHLAKTLTGGMGIAIKGALGGAINAVLPGVGALLGPLASKIASAIGGMFGNKGRDLVKDFAGTFGGFDALHRKLNELGPAAGEQLWIRLTQGVGRNNPDQAKAAIEAVTQALDAHQQKLGEVGATGVPTLGELQASAERYGGSLKDLGPAVESMRVKSVADEILAHFELMGRGSADMGAVFEFTKDEVAELIDAARAGEIELPKKLEPFLQRMADAGQLTDSAGNKLESLEGLTFAETLTEKVGELVTVMRDFVSTITGGAIPALGALANTRIPPITVPIRGRFEGPEGVDWGGEMAEGGSGTVSKPTLFLAGEEGREDYAFSGAGRSFASRADVGAQVQKLVVKIGERVVAQATLRGMPREAVVSGL